MKINLKQRLLPPSSASFHYYEQESTSRLDNLIKINQRLTEQLDNITHRLDDTINRTDELDRKVQILQQQLSNYSLALLNGGVDAKLHLKLDANFFVTYRKQLGRCVVANRSRQN